MTEYNKIRICGFYSQYCIALALFTSLFYWFQGDLVSWARFLLLVVLPLPFVWRQKPKDEKKHRIFRFEVLLIISVFTIPGTLDQGLNGNAIVCGVFCLASFFFAMATMYLNRRYTVLHCNPCVSDETKKRAGKSQRRSLLFFSVMEGVILLFLVAAAVQMPDMYSVRKQQVNREQQKQDNAEDERSDTKKGEIEEKFREEQEKTSHNIWLQIVKYIITTVVVIGGVLAIVYAVFCFVRSLLKRKQKNLCEYKEEIEQQTEWQEITRLVPVVKDKKQFEKGWRGKIRKEFYHWVKKGAGDQTVDQSMTTEELLEQYMEDSQITSMLVDLYKKARYSEEELDEKSWKEWQEVQKS